VIEAAQQCGILALPEISEPVAFKAMLDRLKPERVLIFCDEETEVKDPFAALGENREPPSALVPVQSQRASPPHDGIALVIGPEGGFSAEERAMLLARGHVVRLSLGPRILRADTAAVAALALVQAVLGDWR
jgi:16S rRNA (uracil1498-N3)-methyltransferase